MTNKQIIECLDDRQLNVCNLVPEQHWLHNKDHLLKFYEWNTFFRQNMDMM